MLKRLKTFFHPERFQGWGRKRRYFEGWYFKIVTADRKHAYAIIPGIAFDQQGVGHAFIQILDGINRKSDYIRFRSDEFTARVDRFDISIAKNDFSSNRLNVDLPDFHGELRFSDQVHWQSSVMRPGIMGPYAFAPFMECYHGIVSIDQKLHGQLEINGEWIDFEGGRGYIEKDWGISFPSAYVWMQSNHFEEEGISFKASVARIPWLTGAFTGFISFLWLRGKLILFATYDKGRVDMLEVNEKSVHLNLSNEKYTLKVLGLRTSASRLAAPVLGSMDGRVEESLQSELHISLTEKGSGRRIYQGVGAIAGLEVAGPTDTL